MNIFKKLYCRAFQFVFKCALPILPYRDPVIVDKTEDIARILADNGKSKPLIVTDKTVRSLGLTQKAEDALTARGMSYAVYDEVVANPTTDNVSDALDIYKADNCDSLIAFGGGSPMDCAKGVGALVAKPNKSLGKLRGILKVRKKIPLLVAVPTTAGTGSETTLACVIVDAKTRHKYAINDFPLIPKYAVLDEDMIMSLPLRVASTTGMDALTHAIEAYIGRSGNRNTRADALRAIKLIFDDLEPFCFDKSRVAARNMLLASHLAGRAFSKSYVGYVHALAHALGGKYNIAHGYANAVILPTVLREYGRAAHKKLKRIAVYCSLADKSTPSEVAAARIIDKIEALNRDFGIPKTIPEIAIEDIDGLAAYADKEANPLYPVPVLWDRKKLARMYEKIGEYNVRYAETAAVANSQRTKSVF